MHTSMIGQSVANTWQAEMATRVRQTDSLVHRNHLEEIKQVKER